MMTLPRALRRGDRVAIVAPSSPIEPDRLITAERLVREMGFEPVIYPSCRQEGAPAERGFLAGASDEGKAADIMEAFDDPSIAAIFCARGGSGAGRLMRLLDERVIARSPKIFAGFSDITFLHCWIAARCGWPTFHAPMPCAGCMISGDEPTRESFVRAVTCADPIGRVGAELETVTPGRARGAVIGGNIAVLCTTLGTPIEVDTRGKIVFLEDIDEKPYSVDRMLVHLLNAGKLSDAAGIVFGTFTDCEAQERYPARTVDTVIDDLIAPLGIPSVKGLDAGHGPTNLTIPFGVEAELDADAGSLSIVAPALQAI